MKQVNKNFIYNIFYQIFIYLIPLVTIPYISRVLGVTNIGIYSYASSIVSYFMLASLLGINNYGAREVARNREDREKLSKTFFSIYYLQAILTAIMLLIYFIVVLFFLKEYRFILFISSISLVSVAFDINWFFFGLEKFKITISRNIVIKLVSLVFIFLFVKSKNDLWIYTLIMSLTTLLSQLYLFLYLKKEISYQKVSIHDVFSHFRECLVLFIPVIAYSIYRIMDKTMLGAISGTYFLGLYENAEKVLNIPISFITALGTIMLPHMSKKSKEDLVEKIKYSFSLSFCFTIPMMFGILAVAPSFAIIFFGREFAESGTIMMVLVPSILASAITSVIRTNYLIPQAKDKIYVSSTILGAIINFTSNLILIPIFGVYGACIGTLLAEFSVMVYQLISVKKELPIKEIRKILLPYLIKGIIMYILLVVLSILIKNIMIKLIIQIGIAILVWIILNNQFIFQEFLGMDDDKMKERLKRFLTVENIISLLSILIGIFLLTIIDSLDIIPVGYLIGILFIYMVLDGILLFLIRRNQKVIKILGYFFLTIFMIFCLTISYYLYKTNTFLDNSFENASLTYENTYYVVVRKDSNYRDLWSMKGQNVSYYHQDLNIDKAIEKAQKNIRFTKQEYQEMRLIVEDLASKKIDFLLMSDTNYKLMLDANFNISKEDYEILWEFTISSKEDRKSVKKKESSRDFFHVYIGGVDFTKNNMDLNMILTVNPKKHKVLLTSIPRDYYIDVAGFPGKKDTLSYMGSLGITTNKKSLENLFGISIDYYLKFEAAGLVKLVDEVGGIHYCSEEEYETTHALVVSENDEGGKKLTVKKGCQDLNGIETLTVARERLAFASGDRQRQKNCQAIIIDIIEKLGTTNTITNYNSILSAISDLYETTLEKEIIRGIIKDVVRNKTSWEFKVQSVNGSDARDFVHMTDLKDYVMYPNNETVEKAKEEINSILK